VPLSLVGDAQALGPRLSVTAHIDNLLFSPSPHQYAPPSVAPPHPVLTIHVLSTWLHNRSQLIAPAGNQSAKGKSGNRKAGFYARMPGIEALLSGPLPSLRPEFSHLLRPWYASRTGCVPSHHSTRPSNPSHHPLHLIGRPPHQPLQYSQLVRCPALFSLSRSWQSSRQLNLAASVDYYEAINLDIE
jgi:hypothetical protein